MEITRTVLVLTGLVFSLLSLFAVTAYSQTFPPSSYLFVEVRDTAGAPVAEATVTVFNADQTRVQDVSTDQILNLETNKDGVVQTRFVRLPTHHYDVQISKPGYLTSEQVFLTRYPI